MYLLRLEPIKVSVLMQDFKIWYCLPHYKDKFTFFVSWIDINLYWLMLEIRNIRVEGESATPIESKQNYRFLFCQSFLFFLSWKSEKDLIVESRRFTDLSLVAMQPNHLDYPHDPRTKYL